MNTENVITANELDILIRHYINTHIDMKYMGQCSLDRLVKFELLKKLDTHNQPYLITEKGIIYIAHILRIPLPVKKWVASR